MGGRPEQRRVIPTSKTCTATVSPHCATSLLLQHFIWLASNFLKKPPSLTTHLCRHPNYNQAPQCYCNSKKTVWGPGEVLLIYELDSQSRAPIFTQEERSWSKQPWSYYKDKIASLTRGKVLQMARMSPKSRSAILDRKDPHWPHLQHHCSIKKTWETGHHESSFFWIIQEKVRSSKVVDGTTNSAQCWERAWSAKVKHYIPNN